jgi:WD40 repeat protein
MTTDDVLLDELEDQWLVAAQAGKLLAAAELCVSRPDLIEPLETRLDVLLRFRPLADGAANFDTLGNEIASLVRNQNERSGTPGERTTDTRFPDTRDVPQRAPTERPLNLLGIPGYEVLGELGRGGMGVVYKARQIKAGRLVALKMIRSGIYATSDDLDRFRTEAEAIARLAHPNVVQVFEVGEHQGLPFFSMELCTGGSLSEKLAGNPMAASGAAQLIEQVARGVQAAHNAGVVHRDLKPANVLLAADGTPKVTDFGLAKLLGSDSGITGSGAIMGTPSYMAPEQASGEMKNVGPLLDVYALGALLYECLTGRPPFKGANVADTLVQVKACEPVPVRDLIHGVPRDLETICHKCLEKEPKRRYATAADLESDLQRFQVRRPILARRATGVERAWKSMRRNPMVASLLAGVVFSLLGGTIVSAWYADAANHRRSEAEGAREVAQREKVDADAARQTAQKERAEAESARTVATQSQRRSEWAAYVSQIALSQREWELGNSPSAHEILASTPESLRGWEFEYLKGLYSRDQRWAVETRSGVGALAVSPDRKQVAAGTGAGLVFLDVLTGARLAEVANNAPINCLAFSPDGAVVLTGDGAYLSTKPGLIRVWDAKAPSKPKDLVTLPRPVAKLCFHPDGKQLIAGCADGRVYWIDFPTGRIDHSVSTGQSESIKIAISSDGKLLATGGGYAPIQLWDGRVGKEVETLPRLTGRNQPLQYVLALAFSPDGNSLLVTASETVVVWDRKSNSFRLSQPHSGSNLVASAWLPDGTKFLTAGEDRAVWVWESISGVKERRFLGEDAAIHAVCNVDGDTFLSGSTSGWVRAWHTNLSAEPWTLSTGRTSWLQDIKITSDGSRAVTVSASDNQVRVWDLKTGKVLKSLGGQTGPRAVSLRGDGMAAATAGLDGTVRAWNLATGNSRTLNAQSGEVYAVAFAPNGRWVAGGGMDGWLRIWDPETGNEVRRLQTGGIPRCLAVNRQGTRLSCALSSGDVVIWNSTGWSEVCRLQDHNAVPAKRAEVPLASHPTAAI